MIHDDYKIIAKQIRKAFNSGGESGLIMENLINGLGCEFKKDNKMFNKNKFEDDCYKINLFP